MSDLARTLHLILERLPEDVKERRKAEDRRVEALKKALENTTPERPGTPWDNERENEDAGTEQQWL